MTKKTKKQFTQINPEKQNTPKNKAKRKGGGGTWFESFSIYKLFKIDNINNNKILYMVVFVEISKPRLHPPTTNLSRFPGDLDAGITHHLVNFLNPTPPQSGDSSVSCKKKRFF